MIFKVLLNGQIWIQYILTEGTAEEKFHYSETLSKYGTYFYKEEDIIEFETTCFETKPNLEKARAFVEALNDELNISWRIEA